MDIHKETHTHHTYKYFGGQKKCIGDVLWTNIYIYIYIYIYKYNICIYNICIYIYISIYMYIYLYIFNIHIYIYNKQIFYINIRKRLGEHFYESGNQTLTLS